jgi:hypothetical protein
VERECFFNNDVTFLLPTDSDGVIVADEISPVDCTEEPTTNRAIVTLTKCKGLRDVWETHPKHPSLHTLHQLWSVKD